MEAAVAVRGSTRLCLYHGRRRPTAVRFTWFSFYCLEQAVVIHSVHVRLLGRWRRCPERLGRMNAGDKADGSYAPPGVANPPTAVVEMHPVEQLPSFAHVSASLSQDPAVQQVYTGLRIYGPFFSPK